MDDITDSMDEFEQALGDGEGQKSLVCHSPQACKESDTLQQNVQFATERQQSTDLIMLMPWLNVLEWVSVTQRKKVQDV